MKSFIKTAFLVIIVVLLTSTFLSEGKEKISTSLDNDIIIVDKGEAVDSNNDKVTYIEPSDNIFAKLGSALSNLLSSIASIISKLIGGIFTYKITILVFF